ncbi:hypothetical protein JTB14_037137 [Gonioctena quinquepunctata]|nr:hypothetical protein JTB14_037137 [Gonioctena quinquepunctata]
MGYPSVATGRAGTPTAKKEFGKRREFRALPRKESPTDVQPINFEPGEWVIVRNSENAKGNFGATWVGPYQVSAKIGEICFIVNKGGVDLNVHEDDIRKAPAPRAGQANLDPRPESPDLYGDVT